MCNRMLGFIEELDIVSSHVAALAVGAMLMHCHGAAAGCLHISRDAAPCSAAGMLEPEPEPEPGPEPEPALAVDPDHESEHAVYNPHVPGSETENSERAIQQLARDTAELWAPSQVPVLPTAPDSLTFLRDFVSRSTPCVVRNACEGWRAREWTLDYLSAAMSEDAQVTVDVTPDGWGDAVKPAGPNGELWFVKPEERRMSMAEFVRLLRSNHPTHVLYLSHQTTACETSLRRSYKTFRQKSSMSARLARRQTRPLFGLVMGALCHPSTRTITRTCTNSTDIHACVV